MYFVLQNGELEMMIKFTWLLLSSPGNTAKKARVALEGEVKFWCLYVQKALS